MGDFGGLTVRKRLRNEEETLETLKRMKRSRGWTSSSTNTTPILPVCCYNAPDMAKCPILCTVGVSTLHKDGYRLGKVLGRGNFGVVRELRGNSRLLACKSIAKYDELLTAEDLANIKSEIEIMAHLSAHPNIVRLHAVYETDDFIHMVMELCSGGNLMEVITSRGKLSEHHAALVFHQLMESVEYLHNHNVVHRDLKPENILIKSSASSSYWEIKIADFGLATFLHQHQSDDDNDIAVMKGNDVRNCGKILHIMLSGVQPSWGPYDEDDATDSGHGSSSWVVKFPTCSWSGVSGSAKELISSMLSFDAAHRLTAKQVLRHSWLNQTLASRYCC